MRTIECESQTLHCLVLVSSCMVCGYRWEDDSYDAVNSRSVEQARDVVRRKLR
jgi:hypothetical protein